MAKTVANKVQRTKSSAVVKKGRTILETAIEILAREGNHALSPHEIASKGQRHRLLRIPRGRTKAYLNQLLQSELYNNFAYSPKPLVFRVTLGKYRAKKAGFDRIS